MKFNRTKYLDLKDQCRQKMLLIEDHDEDLYQDRTQEWWRLDDYLDLKGMRELDKELTDDLKRLGISEE